jgi:hypothetical protein
VAIGSGVDWGDAPSWVAAVGTVLTLFLGLIVLLREVGDRRRRYASRVICWIEGDAGAVHIRNGSDEPVTQVMVALFSVPNHYADAAAEVHDDPWVWGWEWLAPGVEKAVSPEPVEWFADLFPPAVRMEFTDAAGRRWLRDEQARLSRKWVLPFREDWRNLPYWRRTGRRTDQMRRLYTRWRWPNI